MRGILSEEFESAIIKATTVLKLREQRHFEEFSIEDINPEFDHDFLIALDLELFISDYGFIGLDFDTVINLIRIDKYKNRLWYDETLEDTWEIVQEDILENPDAAQFRYELRK